RPRTRNIPERFPWYSRTFRCSHGCHQNSRGTDLRQRSSRYGGCPARFSAKVVQVTEEGCATKWVVKVYNETRTHNHLSNAAIGSTYQGSACVDNRPDVQSRLADMVSVGGAPKKITQFLSDSLERMVTPQQARNIIQRVLGKSSVEHKLKHLLDAVAEQGSSVLLLQDQLDVTTAIVIQTAVQKRIFREWGDCLLMDWTHSTNNLGYHL
ncbi:hypothetical protein F444_08134, partial [Phytophthora nicotianae P1976]